MTASLPACAAFEAYYFRLNLSWSIAMDRSASDMPEVRIEILPPDRDDTCAPDAATCPCCRTLRSASSMDDDGCGICDECLAP
ncbi:hypothetical protein ELI50_32325 (plasmid) [Rhizobium leguminosarum]|nr:hypothetical protein ELI50_32325 [Rhizobium leguminosarum]